MLTRPHPMPHYAGANHIGHEMVSLAVPDKENGTGAASTVNFIDFSRTVGSQFSLVLHHAGGPKHPDDVNPALLPHARHQPDGALAEITITTDLPFLPDSTGKNFHLGAHRAFIVIQPGECYVQEIIAISTVIPQQHRRTMLLRDQQIHASVAIKVHTLQ